MLIRRIKGTTNRFGKPLDWDDTTMGECGELPVRISAFGEAVMCESAWEPTPEELTRLNAGHSVILRVIGLQPPVALYVDPFPPDDAGNG